MLAMLLVDLYVYYYAGIFGQSLAEVIIKDENQTSILLLQYPDRQA